MCWLATEARARRSSISLDIRFERSDRALSVREGRVVEVEAGVFGTGDGSGLSGRIVGEGGDVSGCDMGAAVSLRFSSCSLADLEKGRLCVTSSPTRGLRLSSFTRQSAHVHGFEVVV